MSADVIDLDAVRELRVLTNQLGPGVPDVEHVRAIFELAIRASDLGWATWALVSFDEAHERVGCCSAHPSRGPQHGRSA